MGAGVDHILNLPNYNQVPIVRLKDPHMAERMSNHIISQILLHQLNLKKYMRDQKKIYGSEKIQRILKSQF